MIQDSLLRVEHMSEKKWKWKILEKKLRVDASVKSKLLR